MTNELLGKWEPWAMDVAKHLKIAEERAAECNIYGIMDRLMIYAAERTFPTPYPESSEDAIKEYPKVQRWFRDREIETAQSIGNHLTKTCGCRFAKPGEQKHGL